VADGRGGAASAATLITVAPTPSPGAPPVGSLSVSSNDVPVNTQVLIHFPVNDPEGTPTAWEVFFGNFYGGWDCCYTGSLIAWTPNHEGAYRIGARGIDGELNFSSRQTVVVRVGGATSTPPIADASLDKTSGGVPLTVNVDMGASTDPDGTINFYVADCGNGIEAVFGATGTCTYTTPGNYTIFFEVRDNDGSFDNNTAYVVATPPVTPTAQGRRAQITSD
jgi:PKD repeat protein